jgi:hypothetical protein
MASTTSAAAAAAAPAPASLPRRVPAKPYVDATDLSIITPAYLRAVYDYITAATARAKGKPPAFDDVARRFLPPPNELEEGQVLVHLSYDDEYFSFVSHECVNRADFERIRKYPDEISVTEDISEKWNYLFDGVDEDPYVIRSFKRAYNAHFKDMGIVSDFSDCYAIHYDDDDNELIRHASEDDVVMSEEAGDDNAVEE